MIRKKRRIAYVTGTRADYGLMSRTLRALHTSKTCSLDLYVTGMHLLRDFGYTKYLVKKKFPRAMILHSHPTGDALQHYPQFAGELMIELTQRFSYRKPDIVLVLGDRIEMLVAAIVASYLQIPIVHIQGGDISGSIDDTVRHAITKLAHFHLVATVSARERVVRMGEEERRIHVVGAPSVDAIMQENIPLRKEVERFLHLSSQDMYVLVTLHPESETYTEAAVQMQLVLSTLTKLHLTIIVIYPNSDPGSQDMIEVIKTYERSEKIRVFRHIDYRMFLAIAKYTALWIGNSSACVIDSASFPTMVLLLGNRQKGREHAENVIEIPYDSDILREQAREILRSPEDTLHRLRNIKNPWGNGTMTEQTLRLLSSMVLDPAFIHKRMSFNEQI